MTDDSTFRMYRGETRVLTLGPFEDSLGGDPENALEEAVMTLSDNLDEPLLGEEVGSLTVTDADTWTVQIVLDPADTESLEATMSGTTYYWTVKLTDSGGGVRYAPVDSNGDPSPGRLILVERAVVVA